MRDEYSLRQKALVKQLEGSFASGVQKTSVVDMLKDYANDDQRFLTSVVFIPQEISYKILSHIIEKLKHIEPEHYFYSSESMHLTIKNVRTVHKPPLFSESDVLKVNQLFGEIIPTFPVIEFHVEDVLAFPTSISVMAYSNNTLQKLVSTLDKGLQQIGVPDNKKYLSDSVFWGNITLCRFTRNPGNAFMEEVKKMRTIKIGSFNAQKVNLVTGNAVLHPETRKIVSQYTLNGKFSSYPPS